MKDGKELFLSELDPDDLPSDVERSRKRKLDEIVSSDSDLDFSDWEDVPLDNSNESFNIVIKDKADPEYLKRGQKIRVIKKKREKRICINRMAMITYILHANMRNKWLSDKVVLKRLKKLLPTSLVDDKIKKFKIQLKKYNKLPTDELRKSLDVQLVYIIKYMVKWFRLNFKINCNGLRILGYLPEIIRESETKYFPNTASPIPDIQCFLKILKKFKHNRDTGAQMFTGLLRSVGFESRMVFSVPQIPLNSNAIQPKMDLMGPQKNKDFDLLYPYYWTELINPIDDNEIFVLETIAFHDEEKRITRLKRTGNVTNNNINKFYTDILYPNQDQFNSMTMHYVISISNKGTILEVSSRYMTDISYRWFKSLDLKTDHGKKSLLFQSLIRILNAKITYSENETMELDTLRHLGLAKFKIPNTFTSMKKSPNFTTHSSLRYNEVIKFGAKPIGYLNLGGKVVPFYSKEYIITGKSEQQWKFLGRSIKREEVAKSIKVTNSIIPRTLSRRRIYQYNLENLNGQNEVQLYSFNQTCPYIKEKVIDNELPKNKYGNIEIYRVHMVPDGCIWLKISNIEHILNSYISGKLGIPLKEDIQFTPVVTGFDFRSKAGVAVPIKSGVIVLKEQVNLAYKIWMYGKIQLDKMTMDRKELASLSSWGQILRFLRIKSRLEKSYL